MPEAASLCGSLGPFLSDERATGERGWVEERVLETEARERERASAGKRALGGRKSTFSLCFLRGCSLSRAGFAEFVFFIKIFLLPNKSNPIANIDNLLK